MEMMAHGALQSQSLLAATPSQLKDLESIKTELRPPVKPFGGFRERFSRSQSPALLDKKSAAATERPKTSNGPTRRIEEFRGRDLRAKDDLLITAGGSVGTREIVREHDPLPFNFPISALQTPSKAREITITSRKSRTSSASASPAPSSYRSRDTTPLGFREHRAKLENSRESSRQRKDSAGHDHRLQLRELGKNIQPTALSYLYDKSATLQPEQLPIGMALGSPSQAPPHFQSMMPPPPPTRSETMPAPVRKNSGPPPAQPPNHPPQHQYIPPQVTNSTTSTISSQPAPPKVSKWKLFGRFGKKPAQEDTQDFERFEQARNEETEPIKLEVTKGRVGRSKTITEKRSRGTLKRAEKSKERNGLCRVTTAPGGREAEGYVREIKAVPFKSTLPSDASAENLLATSTAQTQNKGDGLLAVDIPSIQMERYSVMFSQLLSSSETEPKKLSTSNLLARRQATLDRLKTVNESIAELEYEEARLGVKTTTKQRRMTSPVASPTLMLFPGGAAKHLTPSAAAASHHQKEMRLKRSNTSPAMLSPGRMGFPTDPRHPQAPATWTDKNLVASPTSTMSDDTGPPTPDKSHIVSLSVKPRVSVPEEPQWEMLDTAKPSVRTRQRSNTTHARQVQQSGGGRGRSATTSQQMQPIPSPRTSGSSSISGTGSATSGGSASSSATTISSSSHSHHQTQQQPLPLRPIPKIKIRHKPSLQPYPSGIVPGLPGAGNKFDASTSSLNISSSGSGSSTPREGSAQTQHQHPERGSSRPGAQQTQPLAQQPLPHLQAQTPAQDDVMKVGMHIPISRFSSAPARRLPSDPVSTSKASTGGDCVGEGEGEGEGEEELQIRTAADVSIARQISISRQQSQMLKQRLARGERRRRGENEKGKEGTVLPSGSAPEGSARRKEREIKDVIDERERGGLLRGKGVMPCVVEGGNRKSEYGVLEGEGGR